MDWAVPGARLCGTLTEAVREAAAAAAAPSRFFWRGHVGEADWACLELCDEG